MAGPTTIVVILSHELENVRGILRGLQVFASQHPDWVLVPFDARYVSEETLRNASPAAAIAPVADARLTTLLRSLRIPVVNVSSILLPHPFPTVSIAHQRVGELAANHLRERGFCNFGFVGHPHHHDSVERETGFVQTLSRGGAKVHVYHQSRRQLHRQSTPLIEADNQLQSWLVSLPKPVGIFASHSRWGLQVLEACRIRQQVVPAHVAVVSVQNDDLLSELAGPSLSNVSVPAEQIGYQAGALVARLHGGGACPEEPLLIPPTGVTIGRSSDVLAVDDDEVTAAVRFIRDNRHLPLRVRDVLRHVAISRRLLEKRFRATLHRGLGEEIRRAHLECAKHLLATTTLSIEEVAEQAGFSSVHYLSRVFRQETGQTPTAYRRQFHRDSARPAGANRSRFSA